MFSPLPKAPPEAKRRKGKTVFFFCSQLLLSPVDNRPQTNCLSCWRQLFAEISAPRGVNGGKFKFQNRRGSITSRRADEGPFIGVLFVARAYKKSKFATSFRAGDGASFVR